MKLLNKQLLTVVLSSVLVACGAAGERPQDGERAYSGGSSCISEGTIRGYKVLNDSNLVVTGLGKRRFHMELSRRASGLRSAWEIGFASPTSRICGGFSEVVVNDSLGPDRVRIRSIRELTEDDYEDLLYRFGKAGTGRQQPPEPEPVEGAEVEELD